MAELKERNQTAAMIQHPMPEEWAYLMDRMEALDYRSTELSTAMSQLRTLATREQADRLAAQVERLTVQVQTLSETFRPAGKKNARRCWRPWPARILRWLLIPAALLGLGMACYGLWTGLAAIWNTLRMTFQ